MTTSFEGLIQENSKRLRVIASRYARGNDADDLFQEILLQIWKSKESFSGTAKASTWFYRIALNTAVSFVRSQTSQKRSAEHVNCASVAETEVPQNRCQADILYTFMKTLSDIDSSVLIMYLDAVSVDDMAAILGLTTHAVNKRISRIKCSFETRVISEAV